MKILFVTNMYPTNKMPVHGIFVKEQIKALAHYFPIEYEVYHIEGYKNKLTYLSSIFEINRKIKRNKYDLIHIHYGLSGLFLLFNKKKSLPVILTVHGGDIQKEQNKYIQVFLSGIIIRKVNQVITMNNNMHTIVKNLKGKSSIIPCSVNTTIFFPGQNKHSDTNNKIIIFPGAKSRMVKNYPLFAEIIGLLKNKYTIEEIELSNISREAVVYYMQNSDLLILTSTSEGSPQVVKEAMACNLPIISTPVGDVGSLLSNVKNCKVSKTFQPIELASLADQVLTGETEGIDGRQRLFDLKLDEKSTVEKIYSTYTELVG